jgi:hypothetical protein
MQTKGIRLNNPGNIERGAKWKGLSDVQSDPRFCSFTDPEYGIRALCKVLLTYQRKYNITTIHGMINRWAPPHENPTAAYVSNVAKWSGFGAKVPVDLSKRENLAKIAKAIIRQENGVQPYSDDLILMGVDLALN